MREKRRRGAPPTVAKKERVGLSLYKCRNSANCKLEHQEDNVYSKRIIKEATVGGRGEKLGLPDKWVKKTQHFKNLIVFCSLNFLLAAPSACLPLLHKSWALWPQSHALFVGNEHLEMNSSGQATIDK